MVEIQAENENAKEKVKEVLQALREPGTNHDSIKKSQEDRRNKRIEQLRALLADLGEADETQEQGNLVEKLKEKMREQEDWISTTKRDNENLTKKMAKIQAENEDTKEEVKEVLQDLEELADNYAKIQAGNEYAKEKRKEVLRSLQELDNSYDQRDQEAETRTREYNTVRDELSSVKKSQENQRKKMTEMLRTLLADLGEVGQVIAKNQDPKRPEQGDGKIEGEFNRIIEKYQAKMGAMTDPDHADEDHTKTNNAAKPDRAKKETEAKHQEDDVKGNNKVHKQQEDAAGGQLDRKEQNLIRSNQPGPKEPKALFRPGDGASQRTRSPGSTGTTRTRRRGGPRQRGRRTKGTGINTGHRASGATTCSTRPAMTARHGARAEPTPPTSPTNAAPRKGPTSGRKAPSPPTST